MSRTLSRFALSALIFLSVSANAAPATNVVLRGVIENIIRDRTTPDELYAIVKSGTRRDFFRIGAADLSPHTVNELIEAEVSVSGTISPASPFRPYLGTHLKIRTGADIRVIRPAPPDYPFNAKPLDLGKPDLDYTDIAREGRRIVRGYVMACWAGARFILADEHGKTCLVELEYGTPLPSAGDFVSAVGIPETDFIRINLVNGVWRRETPAFEPLPETPELIAADRLFESKGGESTVNPLYHGKALRLRGTVVSAQQGTDSRPFIYIESGTHMLAIKPGEGTDGFGRLEPGCEIEVTVVCVLHSGIWKDSAVFPPVFGFAFVTRTNDDIRILSRPSHWNARNLLVVSSVMLLALIVFVIWNRILQRIIRQKSRQLAQEKIRRLHSSMRTAERTALAVELHDSISQNLTGIACQLAAAKSAIAAGSKTAATHAEAADRMLGSCRTALRNCLWDLREDTLEDINFTEAIRRTLKALALGVELSVRFNVPRSRLDDRTAHAIICIVRELVTNAVRHGRARHVWVAGEAHGGRVSFSVRDDGTGFDPGTRRGPEEGHFGLQGIAERIRRLGGTLRIDSASGEGTRVETVLAPKATVKEDTEDEEDQDPDRR